MVKWINNFMEDNTGWVIVILLVALQMLHTAAACENPRYVGLVSSHHYVQDNLNEINLGLGRDCLQEDGGQLGGILFIDSTSTPAVLVYKQYETEWWKNVHGGWAFGGAAGPGGTFPYIGVTLRFGPVMKIVTPVLAADALVLDF